MRIVKKFGLITIVLFVSIVTISCSSLSTAVVAESGYKYTVVASAKNSNVAMDGALRKAQNICAATRRKTVSILRHKLEYQGARRDLQDTNKKIPVIAAATTDKVRLPRLDKDEDYEATVVFECH